MENVVDDDEQPANRKPLEELCINFPLTPTESPITNTRDKRVDENVSNEDK